jgi:hypothetical protein
MQLATAGSAVARVSPGGKRKMNALLATYLFVILATIIVIVIIENTDDGGAA